MGRGCSHAGLKPPGWSRSGPARLTRHQYDYGKGPVVVHTPATPARARRARRGRGVEASSGVRIARRLDITWTYGPPGGPSLRSSNSPTTGAHRPGEKLKRPLSLPHEQGFSRRDRGFMRESAPTCNDLRTVRASGAGLAGGAVRKAQSSRRPPVAGRSGRAPLAQSTPVAERVGVRLAAGTVQGPAVGSLPSRRQLGGGDGSHGGVRTDERSETSCAHFGGLPPVG